MADPPLTAHGRRLLDRRRFLAGTFDGLAGIAMASLLAGRPGPGAGAQDVGPAPSPGIDPARPYAPRRPHFEPRARNVLVIYCAGALSHVDTFDYKPELVRRDGQPMPGGERLVSFQGENGNLTAPLWTFRPRGECGKMVSDLLPQIGGLADEICFLHSLTTTSNTHGPAENAMSTGFTVEGFPSMGAWVGYALGSEADDLPAFVAIEDPRGAPQTGSNTWANGFLPASFQGTPFSATRPIRALGRPTGVSAEADRAALEALRALNDADAARNPADRELEARIASYELAARMQLSVPEAADLGREPGHVLRLYGADDPDATRAAFARNCLLARRLIERGVRFVQVFNGAYASGGRLNWDGHSALKEQYDRHAAILDRPVAALLTDLRRRGLLDETLVAFCTEFGRMPMFQVGTFGRDHNPFGFTCWLAGAGVKAPFSFGATDEFGFRAARDVVTVHDFHATILHLLGLDHEELTFRHNGVARRLTDVHGRVIREVLARSATTAARPGSLRSRAEPGMVQHQDANRVRLCQS